MSTDTLFNPERALAAYIAVSKQCDEGDDPLSEFHCSDSQITVLQLFLEAELNGYYLYCDVGRYDETIGRHTYIYGYKDHPLEDGWAEYLKSRIAELLSIRRHLEFARWLVQQGRVHA